MDDWSYAKYVRNKTRCIRAHGILLISVDGQNAETTK